MYSIESKSYVDGAGNLFFDVSFHENDELIQKRVSVEDYISLLSHVEKKDVMVDVPQLPSSIMRCQISTLRADTFKAIVLLPAEKRPFIYMDQHLLIPFPTLIAEIEVVKGVRNSTHLYALKTDKVKMDTPLMRYPFGNVNANGLCCFGNITVSGLKDVSESPRVMEMFLFGKTNNDYYDEKLYGMKQSEMIESLVKKNKFPAGMLKPSSVKTVGDLLKKVTNN